MYGQNAHVVLTYGFVLAYDEHSRGWTSYIASSNGSRSLERTDNLPVLSVL